MQTRTLSRQGLRVSAEGLGCMGLSALYGTFDDDPAAPRGIAAGERYAPAGMRTLHR